MNSIVDYLAAAVQCSVAVQMCSIVDYSIVAVRLSVAVQMCSTVDYSIVAVRLSVAVPMCSIAVAYLILSEILVVIVLVFESWHLIQMVAAEQLDFRHALVL